MESTENKFISRDGYREFNNKLLKLIFLFEG